jgi:hypothetical protein
MWIDALTQKVRESGRPSNVHCLIATGVNAEGHREILGIDVGQCRVDAVTRGLEPPGQLAVVVHYHCWSVHAAILPYGKVPDSYPALREGGERPAIDLRLAARLASLLLCGPPDCDIPDSAYSC